MFYTRMKKMTIQEECALQFVSNKKHHIKFSPERNDTLITLSTGTNEVDLCMLLLKERFLFKVQFLLVVVLHFISLFVAMLGLHGCTWTLTNGYSPGAVPGLLTAWLLVVVASRVAQQKL